jgi:hypothetical protein
MEVLGIPTSYELNANHYFGEPVIVRKTGPKVMIGVTRNQLAYIVGKGDLRNGSWVCRVKGRHWSTFIERVDCQSIRVYEQVELAAPDAEKFLPVLGEDNVTRFISRALDVDVQPVDQTITLDSADTGLIHHSVLKCSLPREWGELQQRVTGFSEETEILPDPDFAVKRKLDNMFPRQHDGDSAPTSVRKSGRHIQKPDLLDPSPLPRLRQDRDIDFDVPIVQADEGPTSCDINMDVQRGEDDEFPQADLDSSQAMATVAEASERDSRFSHNIALLASSVPSPVDTRNPTIRQARSLSDWPQWQSAMKKEMDMHIERETFVQEDPPVGTEWIPTKWVLVRKRAPVPGGDEPYKARIVVCGNRDSFDGETFSPTACRVIMWLIFAIVVILSLKTRVLDVTGAFVSHDCPRTVFVKIDGVFYRLKKFLYGLKDAPKGFHDGLSDHLKAGGYSQSAFDPCLSSFRGFCRI